MLENCHQKVQRGVKTSGVKSPAMTSSSSNLNRILNINPPPSRQKLSQQLIRSSLWSQNLNHPINSKIDSPPSFQRCCITISSRLSPSYFSFFPFVIAPQSHVGSTTVDSRLRPQRVPIGQWDLTAGSNPHLIGGF